MRAWCSLVVLLAACGGKDTGAESTVYRVDGVEIRETVVHQVVVSGTIVLGDSSGAGGADAVATFYRDEYATRVATANGVIGLELASPGDTVPFELSTIQARLVPHEDGFDRICVELEVADSNFAEPTQLGCLDGTPDPTTPTTTTPAPEEPPAAEITSPFQLELFGQGETVDLDGYCRDPNQSNGSLQAVWTYEPTDGSAAPVELTVNAIAGDGRTTGEWLTPPLGDWTVTLTCTDDNNTSDSNNRQISVVDRQLADLDGDGFTPAGGDCNDGDASINPNADEVCDGVDRDCTGDPADKDLDGDGYVDEACAYTPGTTGTPLMTGDCQDDDSAVNPGAVEIPGDGVDQDCDGSD